MSCIACNADPPGGAIHETAHWIVEHTIGSLGVGTLIVKPRRHVVHVGDLERDEAAELGQILRRAELIVREVAHADQVYVCLWSHTHREPGHIHFVVQPVTKELMAEHDGRPPDEAEAGAFAAAVRNRW